MNILVMGPPRESPSPFDGEDSARPAADRQPDERLRKSLFRNLWAVSQRMRAEFGYADGGKFAKLYGYQKRILTGDAAKAAKVAEYGASSDRVVKTEGGERMQDAPGVLRASFCATCFRCRSRCISVTSRPMTAW